MRLPLTELKGVGAKLNSKLNAFNIFCVQDLLFHLPIRYEDRTRLTPIAELQVGNKALFEGELQRGQVLYGKRRRLVCDLNDDSGHIRLSFFYFSSAQEKQLSTPGNRIRCFGEIRSSFKGDTLEVVHPEYRLTEDTRDMPLHDSLTPIYSTTQGLLQPTWRKLMRQALQLLELDSPVEIIPIESPFSLVAALQYLHQPPVGAPIDLILSGNHPAQQRLALEELVAHQLCLSTLRLKRRSKAAPKLSGISTLQNTLKTALPFNLTAAQERVIATINNDLAQAAPMLRLVQGDVGSGKTIVAALSLLQAVSHGYQAALMAPTELLAEQHYRTLLDWFSPLGVRVGWLSGALSGKTHKTTLDLIANRELDVIVGTHALIQDKVQFAALALLVIDEQHRFGVHQRLALKEKGETGDLTPHQLIMTATPIPRTLAMTAYADLDVSVIDELPKGRKPIQTVLVPKSKRDKIIERIRVNCLAGRQAYWVCTLIEESESLEAEAATIVWQELSAALPELHIGLVHGRLKSADKEAIMAEFKAGKLQLLVATTVIEVGVDVPNATVMVIENAERLGLAQLHQLRGRVGRGQQESFCVLLYQLPLSELARKRLEVMRDVNDGFVIAEEDLKMRGPGEVLGVRQTGLLQLKIADLMRDAALLPKVKEISQSLVQSNSAAADMLALRWLQGKEHYIEV